VRFQVDEYPAMAVWHWRDRMAARCARTVQFIAYKQGDGTRQTSQSMLMFSAAACRGAFINKSACGEMRQYKQRLSFERLCLKRVLP